MAATLPDRLVLAEKQEMSFEDLLVLILTDEIARRDNAALPTIAQTMPGSIPR